jgi:hypothetical protein
MASAYLWLMVAVWATALLQALRMQEPRLVRLLAALLLAGACIALLSGCGGGGDDDRAEVGPPDCKARPELCA